MFAFAVLCLLRFVLVLEQDGEEDGDHEGIAGEDEPGLRPVGGRIEHVARVNHGAGGEGTDRGAEAVGHHHEQSLRAGADVPAGALLNIERTRDVEEVERDTVDDAAEDKQQHTRHGRMAESEERETEHPGQHRDEHHLLDAEPLHKERDQQDAKCLGSLRDGDQRVGILHGERVGKRRIGCEGAQEGVGVAVRDLERSAQQHRENEEHGELAVLEQGEGLQAESVHERFLFPAAVDRAVRHAQGIEAEDDGKDAR